MVATHCPSAQTGSSSQYSWVIAVLICVGANIVSNLGLNFQKLAHEKKRASPADKVKYRSLWMLGFVGIVGGAVGDFAALGFGAQSIVAPLGSMTLVANIIFAPLMIGEKVTRSDVLATLSIVAGCTLSVAFASHKDCLLTVDELFALYRTVRFAVYFSLILVAIFVALFCVRKFEAVERDDFDLYLAKYEKLHRFSYASMSGLVGAQSVLFAKTTVELFLDWVRGGSFFLAQLPTYLVLISMGTSVTLQIYWLNCGLARWSALYNVPVFQSFWIMVSVVGGGVFYDEFSGFDLKQTLLFPVGVILTIFGVVWLSQRDTAQAARHASIDSAGSEGDDSVGPLARKVSVESNGGYGEVGDGEDGGGGSDVTSPKPIRSGSMPPMPTPHRGSIQTRTGHSASLSSVNSAHNALHFVTMDPLMMLTHGGSMFSPAAFNRDEADTSSHPVLDVARTLASSTGSLLGRRRMSLPDSLTGLLRGSPASSSSDSARDRADSSTPLMVGGAAEHGTLHTPPHPDGAGGAEAEAGRHFERGDLARERSSTFA